MLVLGCNTRAARVTGVSPNIAPDGVGNIRAVRIVFGKIALIVPKDRARVVVGMLLKIDFSCSNNRLQNNCIILDI